MKKGELLAYVYDFISQLMENEPIINRIRRIILFGSVARGDFTKKSDVDLFIDTKESKTLEPLIKKELNKFETKAESTWLLRNLNLPIKIIIHDIEQERWKDLREEILNYGKIIYGEFEQLPGNMTHKVLIIYDITNLSQKIKMSLLRKLYGYKIKKGKKEYPQRGIIHNINGEKIGTNSILVNFRDFGQVRNLLKEHKAKYALRDVFVR